MVDYDERAGGRGTSKRSEKSSEMGDIELASLAGGMDLNREDGENRSIAMAVVVRAVANRPLTTSHDVGIILPVGIHEVTKERLIEIIESDNFTGQYDGVDTGLFANVHSADDAVEAMRSTSDTFATKMLDCVDKLHVLTAYQFVGLYAMFLKSVFGVRGDSDDPDMLWPERNFFDIPAGVRGQYFASMHACRKKERTSWKFAKLVRKCGVNRINLPYLFGLCVWSEPNAGTHVIKLLDSLGRLQEMNCAWWVGQLADAEEKSGWRDTIVTAATEKGQSGELSDAAEREKLVCRLLVAVKMITAERMSRMTGKNSRSTAKGNLLVMERDVTAALKTVAAEIKVVVGTMAGEDRKEVPYRGLRSEPIGKKRRKRQPASGVRKRLNRGGVGGSSDTDSDLGVVDDEEENSGIDDGRDGVVDEENDVARMDVDAVEAGVDGEGGVGEVEGEAADGGCRELSGAADANMDNVCVTGEDGDGDIEMVEREDAGDGREVVDSGYGHRMSGSGGEAEIGVESGGNGRDVVVRGSMPAATVCTRGDEALRCLLALSELGVERDGSVRPWVDVVRVLMITKRHRITDVATYTGSISAVIGTAVRDNAGVVRVVGYDVNYVSDRLLRMVRVMSTRKQGVLGGRSSGGMVGGSSVDCPGGLHGWQSYEAGECSDDPTNEADKMVGLFVRVACQEGMRTKLASARIEYHAAGFVSRWSYNYSGYRTIRVLRAAVSGNGRSDSGCLVVFAADAKVLDRTMLTALADDNLDDIVGQQNSILQVCRVEFVSSGEALVIPPGFVVGTVAATDLAVEVRQRYWWDSDGSMIKYWKRGIDFDGGRERLAGELGLFCRFVCDYLEDGGHGSEDVRAVRGEAVLCKKWCDGLERVRTKENDSWDGGERRVGGDGVERVRTGVSDGWDEVDRRVGGDVVGFDAVREWEVADVSWGSPYRPPVENVYRRRLNKLDERMAAREEELAGPGGYASLEDLDD